MYRIKKMLEMILEYPANENSEPEIMGEALTKLHDLATEALAEVERIELLQLEEPQEMRDMFAAAALMGVLASGDVRGETDESLAHESWNVSDAMMAERRKRIEARKGGTDAH